MMVLTMTMALLKFGDDKGCFALENEPEVARVWLPNIINSPGLVMARAFGDFCLKDFGVISVPDISCLTEKDKFGVLATATDEVKLAVEIESSKHQIYLLLSRRM